MAEELHEFDTAICYRCGMGLVVRNLRTGALISPPFWRLAWTHADVQLGTDGRNCWAPPAQPTPGTIRFCEEYERPTWEQNTVAVPNPAIHGRCSITAEHEAHTISVNGTPWHCPGVIAEYDEETPGPVCCVGECCGPGSYCCSHPDNDHEHDEEDDL